MNSMTNLPQLYQDIMRSPYAAAAAAAHFANTNNPSLSPSPLQKSYLNPTANQFMHPNHNPLAAAMVAQAQAVQKQQQLQHQQQNQTANFAQNFVNHMQQNLSQQHQLQLQQQTQQAFNAMFRPQMPANNGQKPPFPFQNQKSLFQPKEGPIKNEFQINNGLSVDVQQQNDQFNQNRQRKKQNPVSTSMMYNKPQTDKPKQPGLLSSSNSNSSGLNRGRGRPPRRLDSITSKLNSTNSSLLSNDNEKYQTSSLNKSFSPSRTNSSASPAQSGSRSRSPRSPRMSKSPTSKKMDDDGKNVTRTSTPSKFSSHQQEAEIDEMDDQNTDIYSSIYEGEDRGEEEVDEELDIDGEGDEPTVDEPINEEDEQNEDEDELNTTASTKSNRTSKSPLENGQVAKKRAQKQSPAEANTPNPARPVYDFTMQALEMSLYGYLRQTDPMFVGHAISGLRMPPFGSAFNPLSLNQHLSASLSNGLLSPKLAQNGLSEDAANQFSSALIKNRGWC